MSIGFKLIDPTAAASAVFLEQEYQRGSLGGLVIPQKILLLGQYNAGKTPTDDVAQLLLSPDHAATLYGLGSMLHIMALAAFAGARNVPVYTCPIADDGAAAAAEGDITVNGTATGPGTLSLYIAGKRVPVYVRTGDTDDEIAEAIADAISAKTELPVTALAESGVVTLTAKWKGATGNDITILTDLCVGEAECRPTGVALVITNMAAGATDPDIEDALAALGDPWYTWIVSPYNSDAQLDLIEASGDARMLPETIRPFAGVCGYTGTLADYLTWLDSRNSAWTSVMPVPGSPNLPLEIAAATAGVCATSAQVRPGAPYRGQKLRGILPSDETWIYPQRDQVVKAGGSTFLVASDGTVLIEDLVTTRTENEIGAADDSFRWTETIANLQAKLYSLEQLFRGEPFASAIVVDDKAVTSAPYAIRPKTAKAYTIRLVDELWVPYALTKNRDEVVAGIRSEIDSGNPGRINTSVPDVFAAGLKIMAGKLNWSFYPPAV